MAVTDDIFETITPRGHGAGHVLLAAALTLPLAISGHAETAPERGLMGIKYLDYQDSQPDAKRIKVKAQALSVMAPLSPEWSIGTTLVSDAISGASPAYHNFALTKMHDHRNAVDTEVTKYLPNGSVTVVGSYSKELDYISRGLALRHSRSSDSKNTTWTLGLSVNSDTINPTNGVVHNESKQVKSILGGLTQVMNMTDIVQINLGTTVSQGYLTDPYKVMDNRPSDRKSQVMLTRWNHHFEKISQTLRVSYRFFKDDWGIRSHTLNFEQAVNLQDDWTLSPMVRLYSQTAANFYVDADPSSSFFPPNPPAQASYYSEDQRLSAFGARTVGFKLTKRLTPDWITDFKYENYQQRGEWRWNGNGSTGLPPFYARMIQIGLSTYFW